MSFYQNLKFTARQLINRFGRTVTVVRETKTGPEWNPEIEITTFDVRCVVTSFSENERDATIPISDKKLLIQSEQEILNTDKIQDGDITYIIVNVDVIKPGSVRIIYKLQVRT